MDGPAAGHFIRVARRQQLEASPHPFLGEGDPAPLGFYMAPGSGVKRLFERKELCEFRIEGSPLLATPMDSPASYPQGYPQGYPQACG